MAALVVAGSVVLVHILLEVLGFLVKEILVEMELLLLNMELEEVVAQALVGYTVQLVLAATVAQVLHLPFRVLL
jgi:hypothetical protein